MHIFETNFFENPFLSLKVEEISIRRHTTNKFIINKFSRSVRKLMNMYHETPELTAHCEFNIGGRIIELKTKS